jgi:hypothetical protein
MMREESMNAFRAQMEFVQQASEGMSEEDLEAIRMAMREGGFVAEEADAEEAAEEEAEEEDEEEGEDVDRWDYDQLLALGEQIGDVKTERWRLKAKKVIESLPATNYGAIQKLQQAASHCFTLASTTAVVSETATAASSQDTDSTFEVASAPSSGRSSPNPKRVRYDPTCCICMEQFDQVDELYLLPCQHYFHQTWYDTHQLVLAMR